MKILAIETSSDACSAAVAINEDVYEVFQLAPRQHTQLILSMVEEVLAEAQCALSQVDAVAFGRGPGAFTGIRVATSVTQGIAYGADLPVIPVSSLAALAYLAHREHGATQSIVATDARLAEVYVGCYRSDQLSATVVAEEVVIKPQELTEITSGAWFGVGNAWEIYQDQLRSRVCGEADLVGIISDVYPHACDIACLARQGECLPVEQALPVYLRDKVTS